jgi:hypothetical protein
MNRTDIGLFALFPLLVYASVVASGAVASLGAAAAVGLLAACVPVLGLPRRDVAVLTVVPGLFLGFTLFITSGISVNDFSGAFGELLGGWAMGAPIFVGLSAVYARYSPGTRTFLIILAFITSAAVLSTASTGPFPSADAFGLALAQIPRAQASTLGVVLTGGAPTVLPLFRGAGDLFLPLALLAGAGALVGLLAVDPTSPPEALGYEQVDPHIPEGMFRSLLPEGRARLAEASPEEDPHAAGLSSLVSVVAAVTVALAALGVATQYPNQLIAVTAGIVIVFLGASLALSYTSRSSTRPPKRGATAGPARVPGAAPAERL